MTFLGLEWYWWPIILLLLAIAVPLKIKFMKWWTIRQQKGKEKRYGKWGDDE